MVALSSVGADDSPVSTCIKGSSSTEGRVGRTRPGRGASSSGSCCSTTRIFSGSDSTCCRSEGNSIVDGVNDAKPSSRSAAEASAGRTSNGAGVATGVGSSGAGASKCGTGLRGSSSNAAVWCAVNAGSGVSSALTSTGAAGSGSNCGTAAAAAIAAAAISSTWVAGCNAGASCGSCGR